MCVGYQSGWKISLKITSKRSNEWIAEEADSQVLLNLKQSVVIGVSKGSVPGGVSISIAL